MIVPLGAIWVRFDHPAWLWAGWAVVLPLILALYFHRRGGITTRLRVVCQSLALLLASISLACPIVSFAKREAHWLILRDVSASTGEQAMVELNLPASATFESHSFAGTLLNGDESASRDATRIAPVLDWSAAMIQAGQADGVILLTDGQFQDDGLMAASRFAQTHAPLWIVPLNAPPADARVATFTATPRRQSNADRVEYGLAATLQSNAPMQRTLTLYRLSPEGSRQQLASSRVALEPHTPVTIHAEETLPRDIAGVWLAELSPSDAYPQNDTLQTASLSNHSRVAWVSMAGRSAQQIPGIDVVSIPPAEAPAELAGWLGYSAVVLADATGKQLSLPQRTSLAEYVRSGGGLMLIGAGPHNTPADRDDPLNRILPLQANPFERSPLHLTVILDASGSMAQTLDTPAQTKWSLVSEAAISLREHLTAVDSLRVIVFSDDARTIYDSSPAGPDFSMLAESLQHITPAGSTKIAPALQQTLQASPAEHAANLVLVLSDLQTAPFDSAAFAKQFQEQKRKLAVVATGSRDVEKTSLAQLADQLHAPLIYREHLQGLADVFARLCRQARGDAIRRGEFIVRYDAHWPEDARVNSLTAYIPAATAGKARVEAHIDQTGDPLIAGQKAGLGRSAVVSAPPEAFLPLQGSERLMANVISRIARSAGDPNFDAQIDRDTQGISICVTARDGETPIDNLALQAEVLDLTAVSDKPILATCLQSAPGEYRAAIPLQTSAGTPIAVRIIAEQGRVVWQGVAPAGYPAEYARLGADYDSLRSLAAVADGQIVTPADFMSPAIQKELQQPRSAGASVWWIFLTGAIISMLLGWLGGLRDVRKESTSRGAL